MPIRRRWCGGCRPAPQPEASAPMTITTRRTTMPDHQTTAAGRRRVLRAAGAGLIALWSTAGRAAPAPCAAPGWADALRRELEAMASELTRTLQPWKLPAQVFQPEEYGLRAGELATG